MQTSGTCRHDRGRAEAEKSSKGCAGDLASAPRENFGSVYAALEHSRKTCESTGSCLVAHLLRVGSAACVRAGTQSDRWTAHFELRRERVDSTAVACVAEGGGGDGAYCGADG